MHRKGSVLVVVDMQTGFLNPESTHIIPNVIRLINEFQRSCLPVFLTKFVNLSGSPFEVLLNWKTHYSSPETDLLPELASLSCPVLTKNHYTALTPDFIQTLEENSWNQIFLCGVATESCVLKTAVDAFELNLFPTVVADACASDRGTAMHQAGLAVLRRFIGANQIVSTEEILEAVPKLTNGLSG